LSEEELYRILIINFLLPIASGFVGVYVYNWVKDLGTREKFRTALGEEMNVCIEKLKCRNLQLLPHAVWHAAAYSGALELFCADQVIALSNVYSGNSNFNYEAIRARDLNERFNWTADQVEKAQVWTAWYVATYRAHEVGDSALKALKSIKEKGWFKAQQ